MNTHKAELQLEEKMAVNSFADKLVKKIFGSSSDIFLKNARPIVEKINALEPTISKLSDDELKAQTPKLKERISNALAEFDRSAEGQPVTGVWRGHGVSPETKASPSRRLTSAPASTAVSRK